jgi:hypothetical protein
MFLLFMNAA